MFFHSEVRRISWTILDKLWTSSKKFGKMLLDVLPTSRHQTQRKFRTQHDNRSRLDHNVTPNHALTVKFCLAWTDLDILGQSWTFGKCWKLWTHLGQSWTQYGENSMIEHDLEGFWYLRGLYPCSTTLVSFGMYVEKSGVHQRAFSTGCPEFVQDCPRNSPDF